MLRFVQAGTLIDLPARIQVQLRGLVPTVLMSLIEAIVDTIFWATLAPDMVDREIGMDPREGTSRSPLGQRDIFPLEAQGGSPVHLVPASPTPIEVRGDAVPPASPVPLVLEEATNTGPPVPIVSLPEISGEQGMREQFSC
ncbi:hypothetical protein KY290_024916 [Solanum tuberosum]|uniref:Integrase core domain containing protein n=1 Tax=Solanum tuberosum TaxID=4113 RepID=A0ABQ7US66_SOLTU|nr:hypothetical protein KY284_023773 [Solanum tuberosum]KAH0754646.1 hypothetical protein KY290_024916 [Solanum tuberosum]